MRKPFSSFATFALTITLSMMMGFWAPLVLSQGVPIEPVSVETSQELVVNDERYSIDLEVPIDASAMQEAEAARLITVNAARISISLHRQIVRDFAKREILLAVF